MTSVLRAVTVGLNMESEWNERARTCGYYMGLIEVPPMGYRIGRAFQMGQMAVREQLAIKIAPWLDPETPNEQRIEAHLS